MRASTTKRFVPVCLCFAVLLAAPAEAAAESEQPGPGVRATIWGEGLGGIVTPMPMGPALTVNYQLVSPPMLEGLIPVGVGELLVGLSYSRVSYEWKEKGDWDESHEDSVWGLGTTVGYAYPLLTDGLNAVRLGARLGTVWGGATDKDSWGDEADDDSESLQGTVVSVAAFLAGEYLFYRNFGFQGELGLTYLGYFDDSKYSEWSQSWWSTYTALSAVIRF